MRRWMLIVLALILTSCGSPPSANSIGPTQTRMAELGELATKTREIELTQVAAIMNPRQAHEPTGAQGSTTPTNKSLAAVSGQLKSGCASHTATPLTNGKILLVGCNLEEPVAQVYEPLTGRSFFTDPTGFDFLVNHTATRLSNGKVLVIEGLDNSSKLYDPASNKWTAAGEAINAILYHSATLLSDGKVLVAGGSDKGLPPSDWAALYDPSTNSWVKAPSMQHARSGHTATLLRSGQVLVVGGKGVSGLIPEAEIYDPGTKQWSSAGFILAPRQWHAAMLLSDGRVLIIGGNDETGPLAIAEIYEPTANRWALTDAPAFPRQGHTATIAPSGQVYVIGGYEVIDRNLGSNAIEVVERFDPATNRWYPAGRTRHPRAGHTATLLPDGDILLIGGYENQVGSPPPTAPTRKRLTTTEVFTVEPVAAIAPTPLPTVQPSPGPTPQEAPTAIVRDLFPCPPSRPIKGNTTTYNGEKIYHLRGNEFYNATNPERCFATVAEAESAGYRQARR